MRRLGLNFLIYLLAGLTGWVLDRFGMPLAWMIGAMICAAARGIGGLEMPLFPKTRFVAQMSIGATVGLTFTAEALAVTVTLIGPMLLLTLSSILAAFTAAWVQIRVGKCDPVSACLSSLAIGPVESATLARHYGLDPAPIIFTQCLRLFTLVAVLPVLVVWLDGSVTDMSAGLRAGTTTLQGVFWFIVIAIAGAVVARAIRFPNPFFNGPTAAAALAMVFSAPATPLPYEALVIAQILQGVWLGAVFNRQFLRGAGRQLAVIPLAVAVMIIQCEVTALVYGYLIGFPWQVSLLAGAPGGVGELGLTAKILQIGVPIVIGFHLVRIFATQMVTPLIVRSCAYLYRPET